MGRLRLRQTVVFRLVSCLVLGGLLISLGLSVLELRRSEALLHIEITQRTVLTTRNLQGVLRGLLDREAEREMREVLSIFTSDGRIRAARLKPSPTAALIEVGDWPKAPQEAFVTWALAENGVSTGQEVDLDRPTLVRATFLHDGRAIPLELLVDGPAAWRTMRARVMKDMAGHWLFLAVMTLMGLLLLRRWFTGPLSNVVQLVSAHAGPEHFYRLARLGRDEFAQLGEAIGGMLTRLQNTTEQLRKRERAFESLYQFAPAAMLSLDAEGKIIEANRRAAELLQVPHEKELVGQPVMELIRSEDRALLRLTVDRLGLDNAARCQLRLAVDDRSIDVAVECTGVRDEDGVLQAVRLSLLDVSGSVQMQRELADKSRLLNLVIDHMSDAIVLVDAQGKIAAHNEQLAALLHCRPGALVGQDYDPEHFWAELGVLEQGLFVERLRQIDAEKDRPAQERFEARVGVFLFQGIPVHDASGTIVGRLWVVQEITSQEQNQRLLAQQTTQLQALKKLGQELAGISGLDDLLQKAAQQLFEVLEVEAVGVALRSDQKRGRSRQVLHRGPGPYLLGANRALVQSVEKHLMPQIMSNQEVTFWSDLPRTAAWVKVFNHAGLTCLAGAPLTGSADAQGILWIARRGGERLERHHIYLLEALAPVIAARLEIAQQHERMRSLELTDMVTDLPNRRHFEHEVRKLIHRPGYAWSLVMLKIDHFRALNETLEHEAADRLLRTIGVALRRATRTSCLVARLRGPVFGLLCPGMDREAATRTAERLLEMIAALPVKMADGAAWKLSASIGLATVGIDGSDGDDLIDIARARVEIAKRSGRGRVVADGPGAERQAG